MSIFPTKILAAIDGSKEAERALRAAVELAKDNDSELHIVQAARMWPHVVPYGTSPEKEERYEQNVRNHFEEYVDRVEGARETAAKTHLRLGEVASYEILACAEEIGAGLVVVGSRGRNPMQRLLLGSVAESVVCHAPCPVLVVREEEHQASIFPTKILLATDGSKDAELALTMSVELSNSTDSELHVLTVGSWDHPGYAPAGSPGLLEEIREQVKLETKNTLDTQVKKIEEAGGTVTDRHSGMGQPDAEIVRTSEEIGAGLIVVGSRGLGGVRRALMGSVSVSVVRHAHCSVMVVRDG